MLVRLTDPERLVDLILFLRKRGFPLVRRAADDAVEFLVAEEAALREALAIWEEMHGVRAELID